MALVLVFARWYRAPFSPSAAGLGFRICFSCVPSWNRNFIVTVSTAARSRRMDSRVGTNLRERRKQLQERFLSSPSKWLYQRSRPDPHSRHSITREPVWSNNPEQHMWVDSHLSTLDAQEQSGVVGGRRSPWGRVSELQSMCDKGQLDKALGVLVQMDLQGTVPSATMYGSLLKECARRKALSYAKLVHAQLVKHGLDNTRFLGEYMVSTLVKCGDLEHALHIFHRLADRTVFSWTAIIFGYAMAGHGKEALGIYHCMREEGVEPDSYTFASLLRACCTTSNLEEAKRIHAEALKYRCGSHLSVVRSLIDMYGKCGSIVDAQNVFDGLSKPDIVSWNLMLAAHVQQGQAENALELYERMVEEGLRSNDRTFVSVLQACGILAENEESAGHSTKLKFLEKGKVIHADAREKGYDTDLFVGSTLVSIYGKCGSTVDAQNVFDGLSEQNVVTWTAMLAAYVQRGQGEKVLQLYGRMLEGCISPNDRTFVNAIQGCGMLAESESSSVVDGVHIKEKSLVKGKALHFEACRKGYESDVFVCSTLISMYGKCGSIVDAQKVFDKLPQRNVVVYNAMLASYAHEGHTENIFQLYEQMGGAKVTPDVRTFCIVLQACGILAENEAPLVNFQSAKPIALELGKTMHADAWMKGYDTHVSVGSTLISMYGKCRSIVDATEVFNGLSQDGIVPWNALLAAYVKQGQAENALQLYEDLQEQGLSSNDRTLVTVLQACAMLAEQDYNIGGGRFTKFNPLGKGKALHADARRKGYDSDVFVGNSLVSMYGKCGSSLDAQNVFDGLCQYDVVSWNAMLMAYGQQGQAENALQLYQNMCQQGMSPDARTVVCVVQACSMLAEKEEGTIVDGICTKVKALETGKAVHAVARRKDHDVDVFVGCTLVFMYGKCGSTIDAEHVFDGLYQQNVVSWNAMLAAYVELGQADKALLLYEEMEQQGLCANERTFVTVLQACAMVAEKEGSAVDGQVTKDKVLDKGRALHANVRNTADDSNVFVSSALINMYAKCGSILNAQNVFNGLSQQSVVTWTTMLAAFVEQHHFEKALQLYKQMQSVGVSPDGRTFRTMVQACGILAEKEDEVVMGGQSCKVKSLELGRIIQADAWEKGYKLDPFIASALINLYGKCGSISDAEKAFDVLSHRNVVAWTAMLAAYVQQGEGEKALQLYQEMQQEGVHPDDITLVCILQACSNTGSLGVCRQIHQTVVSSRSNLSSILANTLIHAYGRCASMVDARIVFDALVNRNVMSWTALIAGYAREGNCAASLQLYEDMHLTGTKPDAVMFLTLLSACCHTGLVDKGVEYFESMSQDYGITPDIEHYVSMVDLLGRAGYFTRVQQLLSTMPKQPNLAIWLSLLGACRKHGKVLLGKQAFDCAVQLQPKHSSAYMLLLNIYADARLWDLAKEVKEMRKEQGAWKESGQSWIEHEEELHSFVVDDRKHPQQELLYGMLLNTLGK